MGIQGLLQLLAPVTLDVHLKAFSGKKVAVDASSWLHKGVYAAAEDLVLGRKTDVYAHGLCRLL